MKIGGFLQAHFESETRGFRKMLETRGGGDAVKRKVCVFVMVIDEEGDGVAILEASDNVGPRQAQAFAQRMAAKAQEILGMQR